MRTYTPKSEDIERRWWVVDAAGKPLGRMASEVARLLRGKHKPMYTPHLDTGDNVIVINASHVMLTGTKPEKKTYFRHSGYMGSEKQITFRKMIQHQPEKVVELAVKGMMPKNNLGRLMRQKLRVYPGAEHPHAGQNPEPRDI